MPYTATFYASHPVLGETILTVHKIAQTALLAYTGSPGVALAAARTVRGEPKPTGFRVADLEGRIILDYVDRVGRG